MTFLFRLQSFLVATAFYPFIAGAALTPRWAVASLSIYFMTPLTFLFCIYCFAVLPVDAAVKWSFLVGAFSFGTRLRDIDGVVLAFAAGVAISGVLAVFQVLGWQGIPQAISPAGLFVNKNYMGEAAVLALVAANVSQTKIGDIRLKAVIWTGCLFALLLSTSRASWLALFVSWLPFVQWTPRRIILAFALFGVLSVGMAELSGASSLVQRLELWNVALHEFRWFGVGSPVEPLHNEFLQVVYEFGLGAAVVFAVGCSAGLSRIYGAASFVATVAVIASFGFPLHLPVTGWFIAVVCGHLVGHQRLSGRTSFVET